MKKFLQVITFMGMAGVLLARTPVFADEELGLFARSLGNSTSNQFHLLDLKIGRKMRFHFPSNIGKGITGCNLKELSTFVPVTRSSPYSVVSFCPINIHGNWETQKKLKKTLSLTAPRSVRSDRGAISDYPHQRPSSPWQIGSENEINME